MADCTLVEYHRQYSVQQMEWCLCSVVWRCCRHEITPVPAPRVRPSALSLCHACAARRAPGGGNKNDERAQKAAGYGNRPTERAPPAARSAPGSAKYALRCGIGTVLPAEGMLQVRRKGSARRGARSFWEVKSRNNRYARYNVTNVSTTVPENVGGEERREEMEEARAPPHTLGWYIAGIRIMSLAGMQVPTV